MKNLRNFIYLAFIFLPISIVLTGYYRSEEYMPEKELTLKSLLSKMQFLDVGSVTVGSHLTTATTEKDTNLLLSYMPSRKNVEPFYISATEVTNAEWQAFYQDKVGSMGEKSAKALFFPDTTVWIKDFAYSYNTKLHKKYYSYPEYQNFPVVGISWVQAQAYCKWLTEKAKSLSKKKSLQLKFRLPTEAEWEYAAHGKVKSNNKDENISERRYYAWNGDSYWDKTGYLANFGPVRDRNGIYIKQYPEDGCFYTCEVGSYKPNGAGLYDMSGNVSEWVQDKGHMHIYLDFENPEVLDLDDLAEIDEEIKKFEVKNEIDSLDDYYLGFYHRMLRDRDILASGDIKIVKGGSWADGLAYMQIGSREGFDKDAASSTRGFRVAVNYSEEQTSYFPKKPWKPKK